MKVISQLTEALADAAPIHGVSVGDWADRETWRINFRAEATEEERAAAAAALAAFDLAKAQANEPILAALAELDQKLMAQRWCREGHLGLGELIELLRAVPESATLAELVAYLRAIPSAGTGMAKLQAVEDYAQSLRAQIQP